jgi:regulator of RNase E activity RraA
LVVADVDGAVVVPRAVEKEVIAAAWEKVNAENVVREAIAGGMSAGEAFKKYGVL